MPLHRPEVRHGDQQKERRPPCPVNREQRPPPPVQRCVGQHGQPEERKRDGSLHQHPHAQQRAYRENGRDSPPPPINAGKPPIEQKRPRHAAHERRVRHAEPRSGVEGGGRGADACRQQCRRPRRPERHRMIDYEQQKHEGQERHKAHGELVHPKRPAARRRRLEDKRRLPGERLIHALVCEAWHKPVAGASHVRGYRRIAGLAGLENRRRRHDEKTCSQQGAQKQYEEMAFHEGQHYAYQHDRLLTAR